MSQLSNENRQLLHDILSQWLDAEIERRNLVDEQKTLLLSLPPACKDHLRQHTVSCRGWVFDVNRRGCLAASRLDILESQWGRSQEEAESLIQAETEPEVHDNLRPFLDKLLDLGWEHATGRGAAVSPVPCRAMFTAPAPYRIEGGVRLEIAQGKGSQDALLYLSLLDDPYRILTHLALTPEDLPTPLQVWMSQWGRPEKEAESSMQTEVELGVHGPLRPFLDELERIGWRRDTTHPGLAFVEQTGSIPVLLEHISSNRWFRYVLSVDGLTARPCKTAEHLEDLLTPLQAWHLVCAKDLAKASQDTPPSVPSNVMAQLQALAEEAKEEGWTLNSILSEGDTKGVYCHHNCAFQFQWGRSREKAESNIQAEAGADVYPFFPDLLELAIEATPEGWELNILADMNVVFTETWPDPPKLPSPAWALALVRQIWEHEAHKDKDQTRAILPAAVDIATPPAPGRCPISLALEKKGWPHAGYNHAQYVYDDALVVAIHVDEDNGRYRWIATFPDGEADGTISDLGALPSPQCARDIYQSPLGERACDTSASKIGVEA